MKVYSTITMIISLCVIVIQSTSIYEGVSWNEEKNLWQVKWHTNGRKRKYYFENEFDAIKQWKKFYNKIEISQRNHEICKIPDQKKKEKSSQYKGVYWSRDHRKWRAQFKLKGEITKSGGYFNDELDAGKKVNQLCEEIGIPSLNPSIEYIPTQKLYTKKITSQYKGVHWNKKRKKWYAQLYLIDGKNKFGGYFNDEIDAAKQVNQLCEKFGVTAKNPGIHGAPHPQIQKKTSRYTGVYLNRKTGKWYAQLYIKGEQQRHYGTFDNELDAANKVNQLCQKFGYPIKNFEIKMNLNTLIDNDAIQEEITSLIKILDTNNDPAAHTIKEDLIAVMNNREKTIMTDINLRTQNGESALSIAAKDGFSNAVKFLISKGADKEHFTNEHHTPLSLAVSHNHLNVVQVLFEDWISPNSHETKYLHLSPIFNVKSREIAQLLIDNDAVTHDLYNDKHQSPLTVACQNGYLDVVEFFLDDELDIIHLDNDNKTPLFYALINKHHEIANLLISKGAKK